MASGRPCGHTGRWGPGHAMAMPRAGRAHSPSPPPPVYSLLRPFIPYSLSGTPSAPLPSLVRPPWASAMLAPSPPRPAGRPAVPRPPLGRPPLPRPRFLQSVSVSRSQPAALAARVPHATRRDARSPPAARPPRRGSSPCSQPGRARATGRATATPSRRSRPRGRWDSLVNEWHAAIGLLEARMDYQPLLVVHVGGG